MKKIFIAIGSLLVIFGLKAQVPVKKETTKAFGNKVQKHKPVMRKSAPKVEGKSMPKIEHGAMPKVESNAFPKVESMAIPKVESNAMPKVESGFKSQVQPSRF